MICSVKKELMAAWACASRTGSTSSENWVSCGDRLAGLSELSSSIVHSKFRFGVDKLVWNKEGDEITGKCSLSCKWFSNGFRTILWLSDDGLGVNDELFDRSKNLAKFFGVEIGVRLVVASMNPRFFGVSSLQACSMLDRIIAMKIELKDREDLKLILWRKDVKRRSVYKWTENGRRSYSSIRVVLSSKQNENLFSLSSPALPSQK